MVIPIILFELVLLWFLSRGLTSALYATTVILTRSRTMAVTVVTAILYPGTVIHELSHLLVAVILGVKTGKMELTPEIPWRQMLEHHGMSIKTGTVDIAQTDIVRRTIVGLAPFYTGIAALYFISIYLKNIIDTTYEVYRSGGNILSLVYFLLLLTYFSWNVGNSMYPSKADLKGTYVVVAIAVILTFSILIAGIGMTSSFESFHFEKSNQALSLAYAFGIVIALDALLIGICNYFIRLLFGSKTQV